MSTYADNRTPSLFDSPDADWDMTPVPTRLLESGVTYTPAFLTGSESDDLLAQVGRQTLGERPQAARPTLRVAV
jgi:hypothetical protein